jgi:hypothetical protein
MYWVFGNDPVAMNCQSLSGIPKVEVEKNSVFPRDQLNMNLATYVASGICCPGKLSEKKWMVPQGVWITPPVRLNRSSIRGLSKKRM